MRERIWVIVSRTCNASNLAEGYVILGIGLDIVFERNLQIYIYIYIWVQRPKMLFVELLGACHFFKFAVIARQHLRQLPFSCGHGMAQRGPHRPLPVQSQSWVWAWAEETAKHPVVFGSGDFWCSSMRQRCSAAKILCGSSFISCSVLLSLHPPPAQRLMEPALMLARMPDHQCMMRGWFGHVSRHAVRFVEACRIASKQAQPFFVLCFLSSCMRRGWACLVQEAGTVFALADF